LMLQAQMQSTALPVAERHEASTRCQHDEPELKGRLNVSEAATVRMGGWKGKDGRTDDRKAADAHRCHQLRAMQRVVTVV
jgi:hypothetical protein